MPIVTTWRDNLNIGIFLTDYGVQVKNNVLENIGYTPGASGMPGDFEHYHDRLRKAIDKGAQGYTERKPGWFFIAAFPFNNQFFYRTTWYVNPHRVCLPLAVDPIVRLVKGWRTKDTNTRIARTRASVAADALYRIRSAMRYGDEEQFDAVMKELARDEVYGPIMEIVTGHFGEAYVEMMPFIELLLEQAEFKLHRFGLGRAMKDIRKSVALRERGVQSLSETLVKLIRIKAGSRNPRAQALEDARRRLANLPPAP